MRKPNREELADKLTNVLLTEMFGEEYTNINNLEEENEYLSDQWDYFNDRFYGMLKVFYGDSDYLE